MRGGSITGVLDMEYNVPDVQIEGLPAALPEVEAAVFRARISTAVHRLRASTHLAQLRMQVSCGTVDGSTEMPAAHSGGSAPANDARSAMKHEEVGEEYNIAERAARFVPT